MGRSWAACRLGSMEHITLYRVEQPTGYGPYCQHDLNRKKRDTVARLGARHFDITHPSPLEDDKLYSGRRYPGSGNIRGWRDLTWDERKGYEFAFESIDALRDWFGKSRRDVRALRSLGAMLVKVTVPREAAILGNQQAVFHAESADKDLLGPEALLAVLA